VKNVIFCRLLLLLLLLLLTHPRGRTGLVVSSLVAAKDATTRVRTRSHELTLLIRPFKIVAGLMVKDRPARSKVKDRPGRTLWVR
jgi:hypothetical protein